jgi:uncharacterized iron-regulated protein
VLSPHRVALIALLVLVAACRTGVTAPTWQSPVARDHPLVGRIWDVAAGRVVDEAALIAGITRAPYVLLGEKHDNPDHHALQARLLRALTAAGRRPAVAFEMFTPSQAGGLARHLSARPRDATGIGEAVDWKASGWPAWSMYAPIAQAALDAGLPLVVANLDPERMRALLRQGVGALDPTLIQRHGLERPLPADVRASMVEEIRDAHCGQLPDQRADAMVLAQRARDAQMAEAMLTAPGTDGAVLIAGAGHVRNDRGVPAYLRRIAPGTRTASVAFLEVDPQRPDMDSYAARFGQRLPFDYVWFTPAVDDEDPCEKFRKSLERMRPRS